ncbi:N-acetylmuramoyl-L-alanine amidase [Archangium sp.]|uniref:N-acetylmuramoyl-L-alanine amidase n=1 Tax=Archangium sp. TaxID=1872627 RepID=UPI002D2809E7|nr:N-acetylmuramoyl-L-alanine amidase [Archangium sp.]HYO51280.1 N-acetylmuramoyl-L-alanine amidase [Archangium sp.]
MSKPLVIDKPSPHFDSRKGTRIDVVVLHHTGSNNGRADLAWLRGQESGVSAHYLVDRDGRIYQLVADADRAWHAGRCALRGVVTDMNSRSLGVEIVNDGTGRTPYTVQQYQALESLVPYLVTTYGVPLENLVGHKDVAIPAGCKNDPSPNFDFARIRRVVASALSSAGQQALAAHS